MASSASQIQGANINRRIRGQIPALLCALVPVVCYLVARPFAETGINDDWSYIKTTQVLAQTGHFVYNGWATAMLGWQVCLGALFVRLFGFSFTTIRMSTLLVACATAYLLQRTFVRAGLREWNATLAVITFISSPLFLPLAFSFMTDISGIFCMALCFYMCLRALQATAQRSTIAWISFAALLSALGGTARQTGWLGVLVMVPSTLWLLRRQRRVLLVGGFSCIVGAGIVFASLYWFKHQPYSIPETLLPAKINLRSLKNVLAGSLRAAAEFLLLMLPLLLMFVPPWRSINRRMVIVFAASSASFLLAAIILGRHHGLDHWLAPFLGNYVTTRGLLDVHSIVGERPVVISEWVRILLTVATIFGFNLALVTQVRRLPGRAAVADNASSVSWRYLGVMLVPFSLAYGALLMPRASEGGFYDRYLLPFTMLGLLIVARIYQERISPRLPISSLVLTIMFGILSVAATHDLFAMYRGYRAGFEEVRASGLPATAISGSWENDGWTELEAVGYINDSRIRNPAGAYVPQQVTVLPNGCDGNSLDRAPAMKPQVALSFEPWRCDGPAGFPPVTYHTWLGPHDNFIYVVKFPVLPRK